MARHDKSLALRLRLQGKSYTEIQRELRGVSKSTLSLWFKDVILPDAARQRLIRRGREKSVSALLKRNRRQTTLAIQRRTEIKNGAKLQIQELNRNEVLLVGAALYWAEGYKRPKMVNGREVTHHPISLTNADPQLLKMFIKFITEVCNVPHEEIRVQLRIFPFINENEAVRYWSDVLRIPIRNFEKTCVCISKSSSGKRPFNRLPYGVAQIRINNTNLFHKVMGWIDGLKDKV